MLRTTFLFLIGMAFGVVCTHLALLDGEMRLPNFEPEERPIGMPTTWTTRLVDTTGNRVVVEVAPSPIH